VSPSWAFTYQRISLVLATSVTAVKLPKKAKGCSWFKPFACLRFCSKIKACWLQQNLGANFTAEGFREIRWFNEEPSQNPTLA